MMLAGGVMILSFVLGGAVDPEAPPPPSEPEVARLSERWYGWQLVLADVSCLAIGHELQPSPGAVAATVGLVMAAPVIHFANGDWKLGIASVAVRGALMAAAIHYGANWSWTSSSVKDPCGPGFVETCEDAFHDQDRTRQLGLLAVILAGAAAIVVDDAVLSVQKEHGDSTPGAARSGHTIAPTMAPTAGGLAMGLVGVF